MSRSPINATNVLVWVGVGMFVAAACAVVSLIIVWAVGAL